MVLWKRAPPPLFGGPRLAVSTADPRIQAAGAATETIGNPLHRATVEEVDQVEAQHEDDWEEQHSVQHDRSPVLDQQAHPPAPMGKTSRFDVTHSTLAGQSATDDVSIYIYFTIIINCQLESFIFTPLASNLLHYCRHWYFRRPQQVRVLPYYWISLRGAPVTT